MEAKIAPHYLRDLALWLNAQTTTPEMREVVVALGKAADTIESNAAEVARLRAAVAKIAAVDYRGNRSTESQMAHAALKL